MTKRANAQAKVDTTLATLTQTIIDAIESDPGNWTKPWRSLAQAGLPFNARTKRPYRAGNVFILAITQASNGWDGPPAWATYKQWSDLGCQVRKGEKGTTGLFYKQLRVPDRDDPDRTKSIPLLRSFTLFHVSQVDGDKVEAIHQSWEAEREALEQDHSRIEHAEEWFAAIGATLTEDESAYYQPSTDRIAVPAIERFTSSEAYYATLAHEHIHWTGHTSRLDRLTAAPFGSEAYAREELVAELGATFIGAWLGIEVEPRPDHAQYLASWLRTLKDEPKALWRAASAAQAALDFLIRAAGEESPYTIENEEVAA